MQIGIRELRAALAATVRRASAGESFVITVAGRPAAVLGPLGSTASTSLDDLVATGAVVAPRARTARRRVTRSRIPVDARSPVELRRIR